MATRRSGYRLAWPRSVAVLAATQFIRDLETDLNTSGMQIIDLGPGGLQFEYGDRFRRGTQVRLVLSLPGSDERLDVCAEVVCCQDNQAGTFRVHARFVETNPDAPSAICRFILAECSARREWGTEQPGHLTVVHSRKASPRV